MKRATVVTAVVCTTGALATAACGAGPAPASPTGPAIEPPSVSATSASPPRTAAARVVASVEKPSSPFNVIGELPLEVSLFGAGERGFLVSQAGIELQLLGDEIIQDPLLKRGLPVLSDMLSVDGLGGRYPDALWLSTTQPQARSGFSTLWRWDGKNWQKQIPLKNNRFITGIRPWVGGRMLALEQAGMMFDAAFHVLSGDARVAVPQPTKLKRTPEFSFCITRMKVDDWVTLPAGEVIALGQYCDPEQAGQLLAVERWAPGARQSTIDIMPGLHERDDLSQVSFVGTGLAAFSASDIFVAGWKDQYEQDKPRRESRPYFAHFDGKTWQVLPTPIPGGVHALWPLPGGVLFATNKDGALWSRSVDGKWLAISWPGKVAEAEAGSAKLMSLWARAAGDTWAIVEVTNQQTGRINYLLHTRPAVGQLPTLQAMERKDRSLQLPGPPVEWCTTRFVLLYTLGRGAPANYDYPATRKALKGHTELAQTEFVEFEREGRRYFGARVPDFELGKKLAQLVKDKVPGSTPELVCLDPLDERKLDIDLQTGEVRK
jgi:hypothetical protein